MLKDQEIQVDSQYHPIAHLDSHELYRVDYESDHQDINEEKHFLNSTRTTYPCLVIFYKSMHKLLVDVEPSDVAVRLLPTFAHNALNQPRLDC